MLLSIPNVLTAEQVAACRRDLDAARWVDGRVTAGHQSAQAKYNLQISADDPVGKHWSENIGKALRHNPMFVTAALPLKIFPPLFNWYEGGQAFGTHIDNAMRPHGEAGDYVRTDISATLFLSAPGDYDGGELLIEDTYGAHKVKLPEGSLVLYPASSLHHVTPVTRGARVAAFFWVQSMVRDDGERTLLFDLDTAIRKLTASGTAQDPLIQLTGLYHNLLRRWADS